MVKLGGLLLVAVAVAACEPMTAACASGTRRIDGECVFVDAGEDSGANDDAMVDDAAVSPEGDGGADAQVAECARNLDCPGSKPFCKAGACLPCANSAVCAERSDAPVCGASGACVACAANELGACAASGDVCRAGANECVECNGPAECSSPSASRCDGNACVQCREDADCGHLAGKICDAGLCVQCTPAKEIAACPDTDPAPGDQGRACDPVAKTCTGKVRGSVFGCNGCASDSECTDGYRCVPMSFAGAAHGNYCLAVAPQGLCPAGSPLKRPSASTLGVGAEYCFPVEALTTCEAELAFRSACTDDADCGAPGLADGLCIGPMGAKRCTYACTSNEDCPDGLAGSCIRTGAGRYCNPN